MGSTIDLKAADGFTLSAYTAGPAGASKGIVVIQEIFGVNHHMRDMADRSPPRAMQCARRRCSIAPRAALNSATPRTDIDKGRAYRMKLNDAQVMADVEAAGSASGRQEARHRRLLLRRHRRLVGRDPHQQDLRRPPAGMAAASRAPRTSGRTARCRCISARRTPRSR